MRNFFLIIAFISAMAFGSAGAQAALLYYGGDIDPGNPDADGIANGQNVANPDSQTYDNFTVTGGTWHVTNLFTNNLNNTNITGANWEIRSGVSAGNGGTLLFSGANVPATVTPTGRSPFPSLPEVTVQVSVAFDLVPGTYWVSVTPIGDGTGNPFESNTFGLNAVGIHTAGQDFFDGLGFGANFENANDILGGGNTFDILSSGVIGTVGAVPEPASLALLGSALTGFGLVRRRRR